MVFVKNITNLLVVFQGTLSCMGMKMRRKLCLKTVSDILNLAMDSKGSNKGITDLLLPETHQQFLESMRVPDWVLLYFKIQAKLPDAPWQTLLNLTQLGKSGVIIIFFYILWMCMAVDPHLSKVLFSLGSDCSIVCCPFVTRSTHHVKRCRSPGCWWECVYVEGEGGGILRSVSYRLFRPCVPDLTSMTNTFP